MKSESYGALFLLLHIPFAFTLLSRGEAQPGYGDDIFVAQSQLCPAVAFGRLWLLTLLGRWQVLGGLSLPQGVISSRKIWAHQRNVSGT